MRYPSTITPIWRWFFALFGWTRSRTYAAINADALQLRFGTADEHIPFAEIASVGPGRWARYYGFGAKYAPQGGVAYVGSTVGVVQIDFVRPRPMNVWGPFASSQARCAIISIENADQFIAELRERIGRASA